MSDHRIQDLQRNLEHRGEAYLARVNFDRLLVLRSFIRMQSLVRQFFGYRDAPSCFLE